MSRRPGRPPLDPTDPSVTVCLRLPGKRYDALYRAASESRTTVANLIRQKIDQPFRNRKSETPPARR